MPSEKHIFGADTDPSDTEASTNRAVGNPPPPAYGQVQDEATLDFTEIPTINGKVSVSCGFSVTHETAKHVGDRKVVLKALGATGDQDYVVLMEAAAPGTEISKMTMCSKDDHGEILGTAVIPPTDEVLGVVTIKGRRTDIIERRSSASIRKSQAAAAKGDPSKHYFEVGDLVWCISKNYLHPNKGKSRAGDLEMVNRNGDIAAVFLNRWSGSPTAKDLGELHLTTAITGENSASVPLAVLSGLVVMLHLSYRDRDGAKGLLKELFEHGALCSVM